MDQSVTKSATAGQGYLLPTWPLKITTASLTIARMATAHNRGYLHIKEHRKSRGWTVVDLAGKLGVRRETVHRYEQAHEQHRLRPEKIRRIATAFELEPEQLYQPPGYLSVDAILIGGGATPEQAEFVADTARRLLRDNPKPRTKN